MLGQGEVRTHSERSRGDLGEGIDHLRRAAAHGARGIRATIRPKFASARVKAGPSAERVRRAAARGWGAAAASVAVVPVMVAARNRVMDAKSPATRGAGKLAAVKAKTGKSAGRAGARGSGKKGSRTSGTRTGLLVGLLAGGAVIGVARVLKSRRDRSRWETNEPPSVDGPAGDAWSVRDTAKLAEDRRADITAGPVGTGSGRAAEKAST